MQASQLDQLEVKIGRMIEQLKNLTEENKQLKEQLNNLEQNASQSQEEQAEIRKKIESMISLIDSIEA